MTTDQEPEARDPIFQIANWRCFSVTTMVPHELAKMLQEYLHQHVYTGSIEVAWFEGAIENDEVVLRTKMEYNKQLPTEISLRNFTATRMQF